jgi:hypothetical protein
MKHYLKISVSNKPQSGGIVKCRNVSMRDWVLRALLGEKQRLMILIPGDSVESLSINEIDRRGGTDIEQNQAAFGCCV